MNANNWVYLMNKIIYTPSTRKYTFALKCGKIRSSLRKTYIMKEFETDTGKTFSDSCIETTPLNSLFTISG